MNRAMPSCQQTLAAVAEGAGVFALYVLIAAIFFHSFLPHLSSALIGPPEDNLQDFWNTWYAAVAADPAHFFETGLVRYPTGAPLHYHSFAYPQVFAVAAAAHWFGSGRAMLVLLQNLSLMASFPLAGLGAYYLVRHFVRRTGAALVGGFVFAFNPSHVAQLLHHAHVTQIEFLPLFALAWILTIERKSYAWLAASAVLLALNALGCWYYLFYGVYFALFHIVYLCVRDTEWQNWRLKALIFCVLGTGLLLSPLIAPMVQQSSSGGLYPGGSNYFVADLAGFFVFPPAHIFGAATKSIFDRFSGTPWEAVVYLGFVNLALTAWLWRTRGQDRLRTYVLCGIAVFAILAMGDSLHILGVDLTYIHLPNIILSNLPFFSNVRTPSRIVVLVYLFLAIGVGCAFAQMAQMRKSIAAACATVGLAALIFFDFYPIRLPMTNAACPRGLNIVADDKTPDFGVLNLPLTYQEGNAAMFQQTCHRRPVAHASLSRLSRPSLIDALDMRRMERQDRQLKAARIKYLVIDENASWPKALGDKTAYYRQYPVVSRWRGYAVLRVFETKNAGQ